MQKSYAKADINQNLLYIKIARELPKRDLDSLYTDIRFSVADLTPGFNVITDLSDCSFASLNGISSFRKIANFLIENHVGTIVRVMNEKSILFKQFINLTHRMQGYDPIIVSTLDEAESQLQVKTEKFGTRFRLLEHSVEYQSGSGQGSGHIIDISTSGCAIKFDTSTPQIEDDVSIAISFKKHEELLTDFQVEATVVKIESDMFAVTYNSLDEEVKKQLWDRLVYESRSEIKR